VHSDSPGPGNYTPQLIDRWKKLPVQIHNARFEKHGDWIEMSKITTPSPDAYQKLDLDLNAGRTIPKSPRFEPLKKNRIPGPGTYNIKHSSMFRKSRNSSVPPIPNDDY
jgi:hypothetical protein